MTNECPTTKSSFLQLLFLCVLITGLSISCTMAPQPTLVPPPPVAEIVQIPILVVPDEKVPVPPGSRIVIAEIEGECAKEVKDALMGRLIDNSDYNVLTRDNLKQIVGETDQTWAGRFNTETAAKLGELMGASLWIVGRVAFCGKPVASSEDPEANAGFTVIAALQVIDLETGKVLVSSSSKGEYIPRKSADFTFLQPLNDADPPSPSSEASPSETLDTPVEASRPKTEDQEAPLEFAATYSSAPSSRLGQRIMKLLRNPDEESISPEIDNETAMKKIEYISLKAAEDMANGFADKFFSRPSWETVEMWSTPQWTYGDAIRLVKLGHCPSATKLFEEVALRDLPHMDEIDTARHLHNYGVALLCANRSELAVKKLHAAYRLDSSPATLKMLGLAGKISEWSLLVALEEQTEVRDLLDGSARGR